MLLLIFLLLGFLHDCTAQSRTRLVDLEYMAAISKLSATGLPKHVTGKFYGPRSRNDLKTGFSTVELLRADLANGRAGAFAHQKQLELQAEKEALQQQPGPFAVSGPVEVAATDTLPPLIPPAAKPIVPIQEPRQPAPSTTGFELKDIVRHSVSPSIANKLAGYGLVPMSRYIPSYQGTSHIPTNNRVNVHYTAVGNRGIGRYRPYMSVGRKLSTSDLWVLRGAGNYQVKNVWNPAQSEAPSPYVQILSHGASRLVPREEVYPEN